MSKPASLGPIASASALARARRSSSGAARRACASWALSARRTASVLVFALVSLRTSSARASTSPSRMNSANGYLLNSISIALARCTGETNRGDARLDPIAIRPTVPPPARRLYRPDRRRAIVASAALARLPRSAAAPASAPPATKVLRRMPPPSPARRPARQFAPDVSSNLFRTRFGALLASLRRLRHFGIDNARNDDEHQRRGNLLRPERPGNGVLDQRKAPQIGDDRLGVVRRQMRETIVGHDRRELASVRPNAGGESGDDLLGRPIAE